MASWTSRKRASARNRKSVPRRGPRASEQERGTKYLPCARSDPSVYLEDEGCRNAVHEVYEVFPEIVPTLSPHVASGLAEKLAYDLMESETIRKPEHWLSLTFLVPETQSIAQVTTPA